MRIGSTGTGRGVGAAWASIVQELADDAVDPFDLPQHSGGVSDQRMVGRKPLLDDLGSTGNDAEGRPDLVGDLARQPAHCRELLLLVKLSLQLQPGLALHARSLSGTLKFVRHAVEGRSELTDLVATRERHPLFQAAAPDGDDRPNQRVDGAPDTDPDRQPDDQGNRETQQDHLQRQLLRGLPELPLHSGGHMDNFQPADDVAVRILEGKDDIHNRAARRVHVLDVRLATLQDLVPRGSRDHGGGSNVRAGTPHLL